MRKGFVFTYDALIAISFFLFFIGSLIVYYVSEEEGDILVNIKEKRNYYLAQDIVNTLNNYKYYYLDETLQENISVMLNISKEMLYNKSLSEILVLLWVKNFTQNATQLLNTLYPYLPSIAEVNITIVSNAQDYVIYSTSNSSDDVVYSAYTYVTGYEEKKEPLGYVAKAFATKIKKNTTVVYPLSPQGAARGGRWSGIRIDGRIEWVLVESVENAWLNVTKKFYVNSSVENISRSVFYISVHKGTADNDLDAVYINGVNVRDSVVWLWQENATTGEGAFGYVDIKPYLQEGWNTLRLRLRNPQFNAHIHPGSRVEITYSDDSFYKGEREVIKHIYYDDVYSVDDGLGTGAWATLEYTIPLNADINNVTFHLRLEDVEDVWGIWDVRVYVNGVLVDEILNPPKNMSLYYDLTNLSQQGTNYIVVYANTYGNYFWGEGYTRIYSDPENDPENSTYVFLNYTHSSPPLVYGAVDITLNELFGGVPENPKSMSIDFDGYSLLRSFVHVAQIFSYTIDLYVNSANVFSSSFPRGIPSMIYVDPSYYDVNSLNTLTLQDGCEGCDYLPESSLEYALLVPSHVGYGNVFPTEEEAVSDAIERLKLVVGRFVNATEIRNETATIGNIPYLYGPLKLNVVVW